MMRLQNKLPVIFIAFANQQQALDLAREQEKIEEVLRRVDDEFCEVKMISNANREQIFRIFTLEKYRHRIAIFHFAGHANPESLALQQELMDAKVWGEFLASQHGLKLVFLNACKTKSQAQHLIQQGIPAVIATTRPINDTHAQEVAQQFYFNLAEKYTIGESFERAKMFREAQVAQGHYRSLEHSCQEAGVESSQPFSWKLFSKTNESRQWSLYTAQGDPYASLPSLSHLTPPNQPFPSLQPYTEKQASVFFGRGWKIKELYEKVANKNLEPLVLFYGQSGAGKSSLLKAGLFPHLQAANYHPVQERYQPEHRLVGTLAYALQQKRGIEGVVTAKKILAAWQFLEEQYGGPLVVVLDQIEEVFTHQSPEQAEAEWKDFAGLLKEVMNKEHIKGKLILSFREEYYSKIEDYLQVKNVITSSVLLNLLDKVAIREIVNGLTTTEILRDRYRLEVAEELDITMAEKLQSQNTAIAPLLQIILSRMWEEVYLQEKRRFDETLFKAHFLEGMDGFLEEQLKLVGDITLTLFFPQLYTHQQQAPASDMVLDLLYYHTTEKGTTQARTKQAIEKDYAHIAHLNDLLEQLRELRLLVPINEHTWSLPHDTLAMSVRKRFQESNQPGQNARRILESKLKNREKYARLPLVGWFLKGLLGEVLLKKLLKKWKFKERERNALLDKVELSIVESGKSGMRMWSKEEKKLVEKSKLKHSNAKITKRWTWGLIMFLFLLTFIMGKQAEYQAKRYNEYTEENLKATKAQKDSIQKIKQLLDVQQRHIINQNDSLVFLNNSAFNAQRLAQSAQKSYQAQQLATIANRTLQTNPYFALQQALRAYQMTLPRPGFLIQNALVSSFYEWLRTDSLARHVRMPRLLTQAQFATREKPVYANWQLDLEDAWLATYLPQGFTKTMRLFKGLRITQSHISPQGNYWVGLLESGVPTVLRLTDGQKVEWQAAIPDQDCSQIVFSPQENQMALVSKSSPTLAIYEVPSMRLVFRKPLGFIPRTMGFTQENELLLAQEKVLYQIQWANRQPSPLEVMLVAQAPIDKIVTSAHYLFIGNPVGGWGQIWLRRGVNTPQLILEKLPDFLWKDSPLDRYRVAFAHDESCLYLPLQEAEGRVAEIWLPATIYQKRKQIR